MKGGKTRVNLLESLEEPKNKLQLAKELKMDWKAVDRHIEILLKNGLITVSDSIGNVKYYSLAAKGREILKLLDELGDTEKK
jgi:DNA-binding transcriptional ArsR family regulator